MAAHNGLGSVPASPSTSRSAQSSKPAWASDEFVMYMYKVIPCARQCAHDWQECVFSHPGEKARRRDPTSCNYLAIPCPSKKEDVQCIRGDACPYAHNVFEYWLHPSRYRTQLCQHGSKCRRTVCFFAHNADELRVCRPPPRDEARAFAASMQRSALGPRSGPAPMHAAQQAASATAQPRFLNAMPLGPPAAASEPASSSGAPPASPFTFGMPAQAWGAASQQLPIWACSTAPEACWDVLGQGHQVQHVLQPGPNGLSQAGGAQQWPQMQFDLRVADQGGGGGSGAAGSLQFASASGGTFGGGGGFGSELAAWLAQHDLALVPSASAGQQQQQQLLLPRRNGGGGGPASSPMLVARDLPQGQYLQIHTSDPSMRSAWMPPF